jgi:hypothetical protein
MQRASDKLAKTNQGDNTALHSTSVRRAARLLLPRSARLRPRPRRSARPRPGGPLRSRARPLRARRAAPAPLRAPAPLPAAPAPLSRARPPRAPGSRSSGPPLPPLPAPARGRSARSPRARCPKRPPYHRARVSSARVCHHGRSGLSFRGKLSKGLVASSLVWRPELRLLAVAFAARLHGRLDDLPPGVSCLGGRAPTPSTSCFVGSAPVSRRVLVQGAQRQLAVHAPLREPSPPCRLAVEPRGRREHRGGEDSGRGILAAAGGRPA